MITLNYFTKKPDVELTNIFDFDIELNLDELHQYAIDGIDHTMNFSSSLFLIALRSQIKKYSMSECYEIYVDGIHHIVSDTGRFESYPENDPFDYYLDAMLK